MVLSDVVLVGGVVDVNGELADDKGKDVLVDNEDDGEFEVGEDEFIDDSVEVDIEVEEFVDDCGVVSVTWVVTLSSGIGIDGAPLQFTRYG